MVEVFILGLIQRGVVDSFKCECGSTIEGRHNLYCDKGADYDKVSESMKKDPERWIEGYVSRSTQAVREGVLRAGNGHSLRLDPAARFLVESLNGIQLPRE